MQHPGVDKAAFPRLQHTGLRPCAYLYLTLIQDKKLQFGVPVEGDAAADETAYIPAVGCQIKQFQPVFGVFLTFGVGLHRGPVKDHAGRLLSLLL